MDRNQLIAGIPREAAYQVLTSGQRKLFAQDFIARILDAIQNEDRQPDLWESHELAASLDAMTIGMYTLATHCAYHALRPIRERTEIGERVLLLSLRVLRRRLVAVAVIPPVCWA